jgi:hypothetical protein
MKLKDVKQTLPYLTSLHIVHVGLEQVRIPKNTENMNNFVQNLRLYALKRIKKSRVNFRVVDTKLYCFGSGPDFSKNNTSRSDFLKVPDPVADLIQKI